MDLLISLHRRLQKVVDVVGLRPAAQKVFRSLYQRRYASDQLARAVQNGREWWLVPHVALRGALAEFETTEWLRSVIEPGMTVFDVGANVGQMTLEMAHLVGSTGRVIAIEPAPGNLAVLRKHISANGFDDRVVVVPSACSDVAGQDIDFVIFGNEPDAVGSGHQIRSSKPEVAELAQVVLKVKTVTVDHLCTELKLHPKVLKIDVEGAEASVLRGARATLTADRPHVRLGFHPFAFPNPAAAAMSIASFMGAVGYQLPANQQPREWKLEEYAFVPTEPSQ